jgi:hypothetical protein
MVDGQAWPRIDKEWYGFIGGNGPFQFRRQTSRGD